MASYNLKYKIQVTDFNGDVAEVTFPDHLIDTTTLATLAAAMANLVAALAAATNGKITRQSISVLLNEAQYLVGVAPPTNAEYSSVTDGAKLNFADGAGERSSVTVPAPLEALFGASSNVVDSTQATAAALITEFETQCHSSSGALFNLYKGGAKTGRHSRRRVTRLIP
jgi:hypothetical protein